MLKKNDIIELNITSATAEGSGVGKTDEGIAVFVPLSAVGDFLRVKILKVKKTYAFGKIEEIITPSKDRTEPDCECFSKCGGCVWRHINYSAECDIKSQKVADAVRRIGGINTDIKPIIACDQTERYRNKAQFPVGRDKDGNLLIGFYAFHSHRIVNWTAPYNLKYSAKLSRLQGSLSSLQTPRFMTSRRARAGSDIFISAKARSQAS